VDDMEIVRQMQKIRDDVGGAFVQLELRVKALEAEVAGLKKGHSS
jgi:hypothetical protein